MGWARTLILGDIGNHLDIQDCEEDLRAMKGALMEINSNSQSQDAELLKLQRENDQLKLYLSAVVRLLTARNIITADELRKMVNIIDSEDGAFDGKTKDIV